MRRQKRTAGAAYTVHVPVKEEAIGMYKKAMLVGAAGGLVLYLLTAAEDIVYCTYVSSVIDSALLYVYFPLGVLTAVITILYRNKTPKTAAVRFAVMLASYAVYIIAGGWIGFIPALRKAFKLSVNSYADNVLGLVQLTFIAAAAISSVIAVIVSLIMSRRKKRKQ